MSFESPNHPHFKNHATRPPLPYFSKPRKLAKLKAIALQIIPLTVIFGLGALGQLLFTSFGVPLIHWGLGHTWWSVLFGGATLPVVLILGPWIQPTLQSFGLLANPRMANVVKDKVWAQLPGGEENDKGIVQSPEWALLIIGARDNSPFGVSKEFAKIGAAFTSMWEQLEADESSGLLNAESYTSTDRLLGNKIVTIGYFRSVQDVHNFAHREFHRHIWKSYYALPPKVQSQIEIWHELSCIKAGGSEGIYVNTEPHGLGGIFAQAEGDDGEKGGWESVLKLAKGRASTSRGRMGKE